MMGIICMTPALQATSFPSVYGPTYELHQHTPLPRVLLTLTKKTRAPGGNPSQFCQNLSFFQTMGHPVLAEHLGSSKKTSSVTGNCLSRILTGNVSIPGGFSKRFVMDY